MDDIRRPYRGERRDYAIPARRPHAAHPPIADLRPAAPVHHPAHQAHHQTDALSQSASHVPAPAPHHQPVYQPRPAAKRLPRVKINKQLIVAAVLALAAVFGGYLLLKPDKARLFTPASLAKNASFGFYYPTPLPSGYSYVNNLNTFQDGQAYYMLGKGNKHIVVREQPSSGSSLNLTNLANPITFQAAGGKAAVGDVAGQPGGLVLTASTLITLNTTGDVPPADLTAAINSLKLISR